MKIAIFAAGIAIIATQIGCTWWLGRQSARLDESVLEMLRTSTSTSVRLECRAIDLKWTLVHSNTTHQFEYRDPQFIGSTCDMLMYGQ